jgi:hypothetical protein
MSQPLRSIGIIELFFYIKRGDVGTLNQNDKLGPENQMTRKYMYPFFEYFIAIVYTLQRSKIIQGSAVPQELKRDVPPGGGTTCTGCGSRANPTQRHETAGYENK